MQINVYADLGVRATTILVWHSFFSTHFPEIKINYVTAKDILSGKPEAILFPGGSASIFAKTLGKKKRKDVKKWVENGGKYIGVCAGAYLASETYSWSLGISPVKISRPWRRGHHQVDILLAKEYRAVDYFNGPIFEEYSRDIKIVARFMDDIPDEEGHHNMPFTPAIIKNRYGLGKVFLSSPHLEKTPDLLSVLHDLLKDFLNDKYTK